jgi:hypothetical protein
VYKTRDFVPGCRYASGYFYSLNEPHTLGFGWMMSMWRVVGPYFVVAFVASFF